MCEKGIPLEYLFYTLFCQGDVYESMVPPPISSW